MALETEIVPRKNSKAICSSRIVQRCFETGRCSESVIETIHDVFQFIFWTVSIRIDFAGNRLSPNHYFTGITTKLREDCFKKAVDCEFLDLKASMVDRVIQKCQNSARFK